MGGIPGGLCAHSLQSLQLWGSRAYHAGGEAPVAKMVDLVSHVQGPSLPGRSRMPCMTQTRDLTAADGPCCVVLMLGLGQSQQ